MKCPADLPCTCILFELFWQELSDTENISNKTKVISADLFDFDFEDIIMFGNISVLVTFQFW